MKKRETLIEVESLEKMKLEISSKELDLRKDELNLRKDENFFRQKLELCGFLRDTLCNNQVDVNYRIFAEIQTNYLRKKLTETLESIDFYPNTYERKILTEKK